MKARLSLAVLMCAMAMAAEAGGTVHEYPPLSLTSAQTARLTLLDARVKSEDAARQKPSRWTLAFDVYAPAVQTDDATDRDAFRLRFLRRESIEVSLDPGEGASFDLPGAEGTRIVPVVIGQDGTRALGDGSVRTGVEVREASRTIFLLPGTIRGFNPQPDPPRER